MTDRPFRTVFALFPGLTQLDFTGPHQVLSRLPGSETLIASQAGGEVEAEGGMVFARTVRLDDIDRCDLLCVPGGVPALEAAQDAAFIASIRRLGADARYVTSVCTGSLILGAAGLLKGRRAACHWAWRDLLPLFGAIPDDARVVSDGRFHTGGGVTAGIDFAFTLAAEIAGEAFARSLTLGLEYAPAPPFACGRPELADPDTRARYDRAMAALVPVRRALAEQAAARLND